jgi:hypothetical protein
VDYALRVHARDGWIDTIHRPVDRTVECVHVVVAPAAVRV